MKNIGWVVVGVACLGVALFAQRAEAKAKSPVSVAAADVKWVEVPDSGGVMFGPVQGNPNKGAYTAFAKFPAGTTHPLHTHSNDMIVVVVSGTFNYGPEGGPEKAYGPGSYLMIPGSANHTSGCDKAAPCVIFQEQTGKFDFKMAATPPKPVK